MSVASERAAASARPPSLAGALWRTARPKQWVKNVLVFAAPGAAGVLTEPGPLARTLVALGRLAVDHPEIHECDVNPLILSADGAIAVDALIVVGGAA